MSFGSNSLGRKPSDRNWKEEQSSEMLSASSKFNYDVRGLFGRKNYAGLLVFCVGFCGLATADTPLGADAMLNENTLTIRDFIGTILIEEASVDKIKVSERSLGAADDIAYETGNTGRSLKLSGAVLSGNLNCVKQNGGMYVSSGDGTPREINTFPHIEIIVPANTQLDVEVSAGLIQVSDANNLRGVFNGCSEISVANIRGGVEVETSGGSSFSIHRAERLHLIANGSSHVSIEDLRGDGDLSLSGAARLAVNKSYGQLKVSQTGASRLNMNSGNISDLQLEMSGASRFEHMGLVETASIKLEKASRAKLETVQNIQSKELSPASRLEIGGTRIRGK